MILSVTGISSGQKSPPRETLVSMKHGGRVSANQQIISRFSLSACTATLNSSIKPFNYTKNSSVAQKKLLNGTEKHFNGTEKLISVTEKLMMAQKTHHLHRITFQWCGKMLKWRRKCFCGTEKA